MSSESFELYPNKAALEEKAKQVANTAEPSEYEQSVYLYFIARYFVSIYEAKFSEIPLQVWNEYRNALDHYFRHITSGGKGSHIEKLECHIQRAVLDVAKLFCHDSQSHIEELINKEDPKCLRLIDNGQFNTHLQKLKTNAIRSFSEAKTGDSALGSDAAKDNEILSAYLEACYGFIALEELIESKRQAIDQLSSQMDSIKHEASKHAFKEHVFASLTAKIIVIIVSFVVGIVVANYWPEKDIGTSEVSNKDRITKSINSPEVSESLKTKKETSTPKKKKKPAVNKTKNVL